MIRQRLSLLLVVCLLSVTTGLAQDTRRILSAYFDEVRAGKYQSIPQHLSLAEEAKTTLNAIGPYLQDSVAAVRVKAYAIVQLAGLKSRQDHLRQDAVTKLVAGVKDRDTGNAASALGYLGEFYARDFTSAARDTLVSIFKRGMPHYDKLIRLIGFLEIQSAQALLRHTAQRPDAPKKDRWAATLALARMGDGYAVSDMMRRVQRLPVTDEVVYDIFPDLVYTRRHEAFTLLLKALNSDEKNCSTADAERNQRIPCGYRIMEMLAPAVDGYPLKVDESGDVVAEDYPAALQTARDWFAQHPDYKILKDRY